MEAPHVKTPGWAEGEGTATAKFLFLHDLTYLIAPKEQLIWTNDVPNGQNPSLQMH